MSNSPAFELDEAERQLLAKSSQTAPNAGKPVNGTVYGLNTDQLGLLVDPKNPWILKAMGGIDELTKTLNTNAQSGLHSSQLSDSELASRQQVYGANVLPEKKTAGLFKIMLMTLDDKILIILIVAALISLALGLYERFGVPVEYFPDGSKIPQVDWVEGVAILVAVVIVTVVGSVNDWQKERQFAKLNRQKERRLIDVIRNGGQSQIYVDDVQVGDVVSVQPGDILAVDGVLVASNDVECDESSVTGESDTLKKISASEAMRRLSDGAPERKADCLVISGAKVLQGSGAYVVTAVGEHSMWGRTMLSLHEGTEVTPLQEKLNRIADGIAKFGVWSALLLFVVLFIRFLVEISGSNRLSNLPSSQKGSHFMDIFIVAVTIVVVAVPEGLPLAVTLALAFATTRMVRYNCLVRVLKSCETMGGATSVCSDKTGTLTQNKMTVVRSYVRGKAWEIDLSAQLHNEADNENENEEAEAKAKEVEAEIALSLTGKPKIMEAFGPNEDEFVELMRDSLCVNGTAYENAEDCKELIGSKTEIALVNYARTQFGVLVGQLSVLREQREIVYILPFDSARKYMLTIIKLGENRYRLLIKGAAEIVVAHLERILSAAGSLESELINAETAREIQSYIDNYADSALRCIATAYRDFTAPSDSDWAHLATEKPVLSNLTLVGIFGIQDPLRPGVKEAVAQCQRAGVVVRMVTGDNLRTARAISRNANIISDQDTDSESLVMEGPAFRELSDAEALSICQKIRVLARSSPQDKRRLVKLLKEQGETVAVTGDGTNDAPALRLADVGFSMGISGTEVAKEASDIIIMDDNFASIVNALKWGRTVNDAVKKFLQFQLTVNVTAVTLTFISAVASSDNDSVLTAVQLLWVNLIMDTLAALALATDAPTDAVLDRPPDNRKKSLITPTMWKMIFGQAIYQLAVTFVLHFAGRQLFNYPEDLSAHDETRLSALVFNTFLWMQFFNMFVNRRLDNKNNLLEGVTKNPFFPAIVLIIGGFQVVIMFFGGAAFHVQRQTPGMWATAIVCGFCSIPVGMLTRFFPDEWMLILYPQRAWKWFIFGLDSIEAGFVWLMFPLIWFSNKLVAGVRYILGIKPAPEDEEKETDSINNPAHGIDRHLKVNKIPRASEYEWAPGIEKSLQDITFLQKVRGGRSKQLNKFFHKRSPTNLVLRSSQASMHSNNSNGSTLAAFMAPMVVGGAIGGWAPTPKDPLLKSP